MLVNMGQTGGGRGGVKGLGGWEARRRHRELGCQEDNTYDKELFFYSCGWGKRYHLESGYDRQVGMAR